MLKTNNNTSLNILDHTAEMAKIEAQRAANNARFFTATKVTVECWEDGEILTTVEGLELNNSNLKCNNFGTSMTIWF